MQIQIKQPEIVEALKLYLKSKGLDLSGKQVEATFSTTRKPTEVVAEVHINDVLIPGFTDSDDNGDDQVNQVQEPAPKASPVSLAVNNDQPAAASEERLEDPNPSDPSPGTDNPGGDSKKTTSLFGG